MATYITNVRLWDGVADHSEQAAAVLIDGPVIVWSGHPDGAPAQASGAEVVDGGGGTLMPGLIDCHIHLESSTDPRATTPLAAALLNAEAALAVGLTAVRDLGASDHRVIAAAREIEAGRADGPHIVAAGRPLALPDGYVRGVAVSAASPDEVNRAVAEQAAAGAGVIKVIASPVPNRPEVRVPRSMGSENLTAAAEAAHAIGLRITAHAHSLDGARDAVRAGFDCIEHGYRLDVDTIAEMARRGTWLVPTLVAMEAAQRPMWAPGQPEETAARARERWEAAAFAARTAHRAGVRMAAGTDAVSIVPVTSIRREVVLLVEAAGMTPVEALRAATSGAAALLGLDGRTGRVAAGQRADVLLVGGDPLSDPGVLGRVRGIWRNGRRLAIG